MIIQKKRVGKKIVCLSLVLIFLMSISAAVLRAEDKVKTEIIIRVEPKTIALPGNEVAEVPLSAARIRSTELRELNEEYNAVRIEKLFVLEENKGSAGVTEVFANKTRKEKLAVGEKVTQAENIFLIQFELNPGVDVKQLLNDYSALSVVLYAEQVFRTK